MAIAKKTKSRLSNKMVALIVGVVLYSISIAFMLYAFKYQPSNIHPLLLAAIACVFATPGLGALWMILQSLKYERRPGRYILIACFIPCAFVWYYLERAKGKSLRDAVR